MITDTWAEMETANNLNQLAIKLQLLRAKIRQWSNTRQASIDVQIQACNQFLYWTTKAEECRRLTELERLLRNIITKRLIVIENLNETKWRQRAKTKWIREGNKNTSYFHAVASHHKHINSISSIQCQGIQVTAHTAKAIVFFDYFCGLIGTSRTSSIDFSLQQIYDQAKLSRQEADSLLQPWTELETTSAVQSLKDNKSPGPDGFTGEFYNAFLDILMRDFKSILSYLNQQPLTTLFPLSDSFIVLVPKKDTLLTPQDYRPISLINDIQKIYSNIMAEKIKPFLDKLLSPTQTGFLKGRNILHGFHYAQ